jgi:hypothetical protein
MIQLRSHGAVCHRKDEELRMLAEIPQQIVAWMTTLIGRATVLSTHRAPGARSGVWRLQASSGRYFLKLHKEPRHWHPEVYAYRQWARALLPLVPELVGAYHDEVTPGILITELAGIPLREASISRAKTLAA